MEKMKLYSPPNGGTPQELPDYWKFDNKVIRRDLRTISEEELTLWGWTGPFYSPSPKMIIEDINLEELDEEARLQFLEEYDIENGTATSKNYDYDPNTHKSVWHSEQRQYIILPIGQDSSEYETFVKSNVVLPEPTPGQEIYSGTERRINYKSQSNPYSVLGKNPLLWNKFKITISKSIVFNEYVASIMATLPVVASLLPVSIINLDKDRGENFKMVWKLMKEISPPSQDLKNNIILTAQECNLPQDFIDEFND